jgi:MFS-type transporter involved in bile tolerance (Atg22 family)
MQHIILALVTMPIIWFAWKNFKQLGRLKITRPDLADDDLQREQMRIVMRIVACLLCLAILPFLITLTL